MEALILIGVILVGYLAYQYFTRSRDEEEVIEEQEEKETPQSKKITYTIIGAAMVILMAITNPKLEDYKEKYCYYDYRYKYTNCVLFSVCKSTYYTGKFHHIYAVGALGNIIEICKTTD